MSQLFNWRQVQIAKIETHPEEIQALKYMSDNKAYKAEMQRFTNELRLYISKKSNCPHAGDIIAFPVNDGQAEYMVLNDQAIIFLPFYDEYEIPGAHARGLRKADIIENIHDSKSRKSSIFRSTTNKVMNSLVDANDFPFYIKESFQENKLEEELAIIHHLDGKDLPVKSFEISFNFSTDEKGFLNGNHVDYICMDGDHTYLDEAVKQSKDKIKSITDAVIEAFRQRMSSLEFKTL